MRTVLLVGAIVLCMAPVTWQAITSVKSDSDLVRLPPVFPEHLTAEHYREVFARSTLTRELLNSTVVATASSALAVGVGGLCAFALARLPLGGKPWILGLVLAVSMFPPIAVMSPLYLLVRALGLRDTLEALILTHTTYSLPLAIWILTSFFRQLPVELYWAARVDGCTPLSALFRVIAPPALPGIAVTGLLLFIYSWNEFMFALTLTATEASRTVPVAIAQFPGLHEVPWGEMAAASLIVTGPVALLALVFQRYIVAGLTAGSVKG
ncbi:MAG TPA: carbohydrate ABC transporter permease [Nitrospira sp.]|jgi:multiple sugar transport system permease protein|nr:carbohydrate ABC transporter permease [Nitrospira sp.]